MAVPGPVTSAMSAGCHDLLRPRNGVAARWSTGRGDVLDGDRGPSVTPARTDAADAGPGTAPPGDGSRDRPARRAAVADERPSVLDALDGTSRRCTTACRRRRPVSVADLVQSRAACRPVPCCGPAGARTGRARPGRAATACAAAAATPAAPRGRVAVHRRPSPPRASPCPAAAGAAASGCDQWTQRPPTRGDGRAAGRAAAGTGRRRWPRFERHLRLERNRSAHTVRAYVGDLAGYLDHLARLGGPAVADLDLGHLRGLAGPAAQAGAPRGRPWPGDRPPLRTFTAWAHRTGLIADDPGQLLASPQGAPHPARGPARRRGRAADDRRPTDDAPEPVGLRDRLVVELLYATGIRVSELVGLDVDDVDRRRRVLRVLGKGDKQRTVPYGLAADRALDDWLTGGRPALGRGGVRAGAAARRPRRPDRPAHRAADRARAGRGRCRRPGHRPARPAAHAPRRTCSRAAPTCAPCRRCSATPTWRRPRSTRTCRSSGCAAPTEQAHPRA